MRTTTLERFMSHTHPEPMSGCWLWSGSLDRDGYARFAPAGTKTRGAHRVSYELYIGQILPGMQLDHLCRVRSCVNPRHLEPVTSRENTVRGVNHVADRAKLTTCPEGHAFTVIRDSGRVYRRCMECCRKTKRAWDAKRRARNRAAKMNASAAPRIPQGERSMKCAKHPLPREGCQTCFPPPNPAHWSEALVTIDGVPLTHAQSMTVRVAVSSFLMSLNDPGERAALGPIAASYDARLSEVERMIIRSAERPRAAPLKGSHDVG